MRQIVYAMRFTGQATPVGPDGTVLRASTRAPSTATSCGMTPSARAISHPAPMPRASTAR